VVPQDGRSAKHKASTPGKVGLALSSGFQGCYGSLNDPEVQRYSQATFLITFSATFLTTFSGLHMRPMLAAPLSYSIRGATCANTAHGWLEHLVLKYFRGLPNQGLALTVPATHGKVQPGQHIGSR